MSLASLLPAPKNATGYQVAQANPYAAEGIVATIGNTAANFSNIPNAIEPPKYGEREGTVRLHISEPASHFMRRHLGRLARFYHRAQPLYCSVARCYLLGFVPREAADFGDGGAFPEIHVLQYPLDMGKKDKQGTTTGSKTTALMVR